MVGRGDPVKPAAARGVAAAVAAGALFALAGHLGLIRAFGTVLPYRDQWQCTGLDLLGPWANGQLSLATFFSPLNDHWPVLTRLLSFGLIQANGQWNNELETTVNALLFAGSIALFLRLILPGLSGAWRPAIALAAGAILALPITWENTLWGIQSLVYLQIGLTIVYLGAVATQRALSATWWIGHAAGVAVLFTQHSAILAHISAAFLLLWRAWARPSDRRVVGAGLAFALIIVASFAAFFPSLTVTAALRADTWELALDVFLRQLAWPLPHPGWALLLYAPWLCWLAARVRRRELDATDSFLLVAGLWVGGQAAAIGYGRAAETFTFASRYCDFLSLGWIVNAACIARLLSANQHRTARLVATGAAVLWLVLPLKSFWWETTESHAGYNLPLRAETNARNLNRLRAFYASNNPAVLTGDPGTAAELFTFPPSLPPLLAQPVVQSVLPPETGSPRARRDHGRLGWLPAGALPLAPWMAGAGLLLAGWSLLQVGVLPGRREASPLTTASPSLGTGRLAAALGVAGAAAAIAALCWHNAGTFDRKERLAQAFAPLEVGVEFSDLAFQRFDGEAHPIVPARGAVDTTPPAVRPFWYGTRLRGERDFQGVLASGAVHVNRRYLVVPFTGHPCFPGNGLRWRFAGAQQAQDNWESYVGTDAGHSWNLWVLDAAAYRGTDAALFMFDGGAGETGWLGVARPAQTDDPTFAPRWRARLRAERAESTHHVLALTALIAGTASLAIFLLGRRIGAC